MSMVSASRGKVVALFAASSESMALFRLPFVEMLCGRGHEVHIIVPNDSERAINLLRHTKATIHLLAIDRVGLKPWREIRAFIGLRRLLRTIGADCVLGYAHKPILWLGLAAPAMATCYGMLCGLGYAFTGSGWKRRLLRRALRLVYPFALRRFAGVFVLNHDDFEVLRRGRFVPSHVPMLVLPGEGVPLDGFGFKEVNTGGALKVLMIARLLVDKGVREYLAVAARLRRGGAMLEFHLVGPLDSNPSAIPIQEVQDAVAAGAVFYHGAQDDVVPYLEECTVYVLPSYREGTPRTVLEAMATGRPIITTDVPGCRETIRDVKPPDKDGVREGRNGFLVPAKSLDSLAAAVLQFTTNPQLAHRMGVEGRRIIEECYDVNRVSSQIMQFMRLTGVEPMQTSLRLGK